MEAHTSFHIIPCKLLTDCVSLWSESVRGAGDEVFLINTVCVVESSQAAASSVCIGGERRTNYCFIPNMWDHHLVDHYGLPRSPWCHGALGGMNRGLLYGPVELDYHAIKVKALSRPHTHGATKHSWWGVCFREECYFVFFLQQPYPSHWFGFECVVRLDPEHKLKLCFGYPDESV